MELAGRSVDLKWALSKAGVGEGGEKERKNKQTNKQTNKQVRHRNQNCCKHEDTSGTYGTTLQNDDMDSRVPTQRGYSQETTNMVYLLNLWKLI